MSNAKTSKPVGNITRDPDLPSPSGGTAVTTFAPALNTPRPTAQPLAVPRAIACAPRP